MASELSTGLFEPLAQHAGQSESLRPSLGYWAEAWRRLRGSVRAMLSLVTVALLVLMALAGPWLWPQSPELQDLSLVSSAPILERREAVVVEDFRDWPAPQASPGPALPASVLGAPAGLRTEAQPNTEFVRLVWQPVPGATAYRVFRHLYPPRDRDDLGVPLDELPATRLGYEDRLSLDAVTYHYSVVAVGSGEESPHASTLAVTPVQAVALADARYRGLVPEQGEAIGQRVLLERHPLGTDHLGRDMLARIIHGAGTSLFIGIVAPLLYVVLGVLYGGLAGYLGGRVDDLMMRFADFVIALPFLLFMILLRVAFGIGPGESGVLPMLISLVILSWPGTARLVRGQMLAIREEPYLQAARMMGAPPGYLIVRHMLPNVMGVVLVSLTFAIPAAIFVEAFLSFIGMGVVPPTPSWGSMCNDGIRTMQTHPHELIIPALFISITVLAFNLLGDALRDALDARLRGRE